MIVGLCLAAPTLCGAIVASVAVHIGVLAIPFKDASTGAKAPAAVSQVVGKDGQPISVRIALTRNPKADLPPDFVSHSNAPGTSPATVVGAGLAALHLQSTMTDALRASELASMTSGQDPAAATRYLTTPVVDDAALVYLFKEHVACQGATLPGKPVNSCAAGGFGNDNCYCNWRNSEPTEAAYNPAKYAQGLAAYRAAGRPNINNYAGFRLQDGRFYWGPSAADASPFYKAVDYRCPDGMSLNYAAGSCSQSTDYQHDGKCDLYFFDSAAGVDGAYRSNPFDADCANSANSVSFRSDGCVDVAAGDGTVSSICPPSPIDGLVEVAKKEPSTDGKTQLVEKAKVNPGPGPGAAPSGPDGAGAAGSVQEKSSGQKDGVDKKAPISLGSGSPSAAGSGCGGPGQPACKFEPVGDGKANLGDVSAKGLPVPAELKGRLGDYGQTTFSVSPVCPPEAFSFAIPFPSALGGPVELSSLTPGGVGFCEIISPFESLIRAVELACAAILAGFIVLRA